MEPQRVPMSPVLPEQSPHPHAVRISYLPALTAITVAVVVLAALGITMVATLIFPSERVGPFLTAAVTIVAPTLTALLALLKSQENAAAIQNVHVEVNSRLTQLLEQTSIAQRAEGRAEGIAAHTKESNQ
jgi:hypothetical protein